METYHSELFVIVFAAALAPLLAELPAAFRLPVVVLEIVLGIIIGPRVLHLVGPDGMLGVLGDLGLTFLLFLVGLEIDIGEIAGRPMSLAVGGWFLSFLVAMALSFLFSVVGLIQAPPLLVAVALSTTALGILVPILRDGGKLGTDFGKYLLAAGAMGEFGPLVAIALLLFPTHATVLHSLLMVVFLALAFGAAYLALHMHALGVLDWLAKTLQTSGQLPVRLCIALQALLATLAGAFGLNMVMGAFAAGMVVGLVSRNEQGSRLREKLDAIGYGFLVPIFFIVAGMRFDLAALWSGPLVPVQIIVLLVLLILVRGVPAWLYGKALAPEDKLPFALYSATGLPLIVIISELGVAHGLMAPGRAAVLVSAGMISVLLFPVLAERFRGTAFRNRD
jgi:Kef-type K+ transport system membrane component KefB